MKDGNRPDDRYYPREIYVPIENYSSALIRELDRYLNAIKVSYDVDMIEVYYTLRAVLFPNDNQLQVKHPTESLTVWEMVQQYTRCIMQQVGRLAECVLVDNCASNSYVIVPSTFKLFFS